MRSPHEGSGNPEALSGNLAGHWSRRIDETSRMIYRATDNSIEIIVCTDRYGDT
jgi:toxin YoeB